MRLLDPDYRAFFDSNLEVRLVLDPADGHILKCNRKACAFYDLSEEELLKRSIDDFDLDAAQNLPLFARLEGCELGHVERLELRHEGANGAVMTVVAYVELISHDGRPLLLVGLRDISDLMQTRKELQEFRERYELAVSGANEGIWDWNIVTHTNFWSDRCKELLGYAPHEVDAAEETIYDYVHPEDAERVRQSLAAHLQKRAGYDMEYRLRCQGGEYRWFHVRGQAVWNQSGRAIRMAGSIRDITERIEGEMRWHKSEQRFTLAVAKMEETHRAARVERQHQAVLSLATDSTLCDDGIRAACAQITEAGCNVLNVGRCSVMMFSEDRKSLEAVDLFVAAKNEHFNGYVSEAKDFADYFSFLQTQRVLAIADPRGDPRTREFPKEFLDKRSVLSMLDVSVRRAGVTIGSIRFSEVRAPRIWREDEINFAVDLAQQVARVHGVVETTAMHEHQLELEKRMLQAQKLESLGVMAGGIAHDFNNLLVVILGNSDLVGSMLPSGTREHQLVGEIENASRRAAELCQQMLAYSGHTTFESKTFDLSALVEEMTHLLRASIAQKAQVEYYFESGLPLIQGDPTQVRQVIMNLIVNAAEAVTSSGGNIQVNTGSAHFSPGETQHGLDVAKAGRHVYLEVKDDGCGMTSEVLERIYDPFFSTKFTGRGLGLASILGIMRACDGGISIQTTPNEGSSFRVLFPVAENEEGSRLSAALTDHQQSAWRGSGKALLVDDDQTVLLLGHEMLSRLGFEVLTASNGEEAIRLFGEHHQELGLVFLDLTMPHMDGAETLCHLRAINDKVPVVISSGYTAQDVAERIGEAEIAAFVQKPFTLDQLQRTLATVLS